MPRVLYRLTVTVFTLRGRAQDAEARRGTPIPILDLIYEFRLTLQHPVETDCHG